MTLATPGQCSEATARALTDQLRQSLTVSWDLLVEAYQRRAWAALGYDTWDAYTDVELGTTRLRIPREQRREVVASMTEAGMSVRAIGSALGVATNTVMSDKRQVSQTATPEPEIHDAEIVHTPVDDVPEEFGGWRGESERDDLGDRVARELAASDRNYAERAAESEVDAAGKAHHDRLTGHDLSIEERRERASVLGTDGKTYPAAPKPAAPRRRPLPESFWQAAYDLTKVTERIERLADDDRFPQNAEQVATAHRNDLLRAIDALQGVIDRLPQA